MDGPGGLVRVACTVVEVGRFVGPDRLVELGADAVLKG